MTTRAASPRAAAASDPRPYPGRALLTVGDHEAPRPR